MTLADKLKKIMANPILWIETFVTIVDKRGKKVSFQLNPQQKELVNGLDKYNIVLKSRQLGITSVSCALSLYYAITIPDSHCMLISYSMDSANQIFDKLKQMYLDLPNVIKPKELANNRSCLKFDNGSKITVCTMGSKELGRGSSLRFCHISEVGFCKQDKINDQLVALEQALLPNAQIILESTANGMNEFSTMWEKSENGDSLYKPFFFSWCKDYVMFAQEYKDFAKRYKAINGKSLTKEELTEEELEYMKLGATLDMIMWSRMKIKNSGLDKFNQEYPSTPLQAFITSGNNVFDSKLVQLKFMACKVYERIKTIINMPTVLKPYLKNYLKVWELLKHGEKYYIGGDYSDGLGQDYHVIEVYNKDLVQCAEFRTNKLQPYVMAEITYELGKYYNNALMTIEKASGGNVVLDRLVHNYHYKNLYKHKEFDVRGKAIKKVGWVTSAKSKPLLIADFVEFFENEDIFIKSEDTLREMKTYMYDGNSANGERGSNDDTVIATALVVQGFKNKTFYY